MYHFLNQNMLIRTLSIKNGVKTLVPESLFNEDGLRQHFVKEETVKFLQANQGLGTTFGELYVPKFSSLF